MCGRSCDEMPVKRARPLFFAQSRALISSSIVASSCWLLCSWQVIRHRSTYSWPAVLQAVLEALLQFLEGPPFGIADFGVAPGVAQVHLVAAALERLAVGDHFVAPAGVDVVDAAVDAAADHFVAVLVELGIAGAPAEPALAAGLVGQHLVDAASSARPGTRPRPSCWSCRSGGTPFPGCSWESCWCPRWSGCRRGPSWWPSIPPPPGRRQGAIAHEISASQPAVCHLHFPFRGPQPQRECRDDPTDVPHASPIIPKIVRDANPTVREACPRLIATPDILPGTRLRPADMG